MNGNLEELFNFAEIGDENVSDKAHISVMKRDGGVSVPVQSSHRIGHSEVRVYCSKIYTHRSSTNVWKYGV